MSKEVARASRTRLEDHGYDGMPVMITERPTWSEVRSTDVRFGYKIQLWWSAIMWPFRFLAIAFLVITEKWHVFLIVAVSVASLILVAANR
ncbi:hypothetical protein Aple_034270 [Acrocarpospora pleiomorpha]|uniref:Uncharacterized protein n=1 Tax=Acrocarpospora pleiomorpha TaxID=90975 RepID=A0A5M3XLK5_9ACTN|nr:hypothetical protein [Acrocarpospora pleiomorpha]GES20531.1 hypothetical protein Aple_034270 [Acrocarpospora pleiomorpha]